MKVYHALIKSLIGLFIAAIAVSGCTQPNETSQTSGQETTQRLQVVATFYPMVEFTRQVAGEYAEVTALIPSGTEAHDWEPAPKDVAAIQEADVFVYNGLVESWAEDVLGSAQNENRIVVRAIDGMELMEGLAHSHDHEHEDDEEHEHEDEEAHEHEAEETHEDEHAHEDEETSLDPHVWLSPVLAQQQVRRIQAGLEQADPDNKDNYKKNADAFIAKLQALDEAYRTQINGVKRKQFVTQHAAFGYLAKEYHLIQVPISGLSPEQEPSAERMAEIVAFTKEYDVKTIFFETLVDPKIAQTIADELGANTDVLNPLEGLTDEDIAGGLDYLSIMNNNLAALIKALNE